MTFTQVIKPYRVYTVVYMTDRHSPLILNTETQRDSSISQATHDISLPDFPPKSGIFLFV